MAERVTIGAATLWCGDCREILPTIPRPAAIVSDPPYGIAFSHNGSDRSGIGKGRFATRFAGVRVVGDDAPIDPAPLLNHGGDVILWGANHYADRLPASSAWLVWDKRATTKHTNDFADCELAWTNLGSVARMFRHQWDGMMRASERGVPRDHPTQKPVRLMAWCVAMTSRGGGGRGPLPRQRNDRGGLCSAGASVRRHRNRASLLRRGLPPDRRGAATGRSVRAARGGAGRCTGRPADGR